MSNLTVEERDSVLVIDSRLLARELEINHGDWMTNVLLKYREEIEKDFGVIRFENGKPLKGSKGGRPERFAWLTEEQATLLMTYSKNTEPVRCCKRKLVKAFAEARRIIERVVPERAEEIERLQLELQLAQTRERLMLSTQALATLHGPEMVALLLGKPEAIVTRTEKVETLVTVDHQGRALSEFDGIGISYLAKRYGFNGNTRACRQWLESIGVKEEQWLTEPSLVQSRKLPREILPWLDRQFASRQGTRQTLLGE